MKNNSIIANIRTNYLLFSTIIILLIQLLFFVFNFLKQLINHDSVIYDGYYPLFQLLILNIFLPIVLGIFFKYKRDNTRGELLKSSFFISFGYFISELLALLVYYFRGLPPEAFLDMLPLIFIYAVYAIIFFILFNFGYLINKKVFTKFV